LFKDFGFVSFVPATKIDNFVESLKDGKIKATKCKICNQMYLPPRAECPRCMKEEMDWIDLNNKGRLLTYTTLHYGPSGFEDKTPYTLGVVDFEQGGRLLGMVEGLDEKSISIGMKVKVTPKIINERVVLSIEKGE
jgi:uncharacterized OB-fold protein